MATPDIIAVIESLRATIRLQKSIVRLKDADRMLAANLRTTVSRMREDLAKVSALCDALDHTGAD